MFYTSVWCLNGEARLKENVPLLALGDSVVKFGSQKRITALVLEGFKDISQQYIQELAARNIDLVDFTKEFEGIVENYPRIRAHYSHYERNCLLRWIAFDKHYGSRHEGQFWHLDGDAALYVSLDEIAQRTKGLTFMTLGCPCFITVSQAQWFATYRDELKKLENDIAGYLENGGVTKEECRARDYEKFNASLYREPIGSDQDLLEYLISSGKLYQEDYRRIVDTGFYYIQNPLSFFQMDAYLADRSARKILSDGVGHLIYKKREIPFLHYQSGFYYFSVVVSYVGRLRFLAKLLLRYNTKEDAWEPSAIGQYLWKVFREMAPRRFSRNAMLAALSKNDKKGELEAVKLLNKSMDTIRSNR
jgi:hypothetical protein